MTQISAFTTVDDLSQVAVGFANGSVTVIRGDFIHDRGARQRIVFESEEPITGLETQHGPVTLLYISTTSRILTLVIGGRGQGQPARVLEDTGCGLGCMTLDKETGDVLIAREDAVYTYGPRGRGPSYAFESPKTSINAFRDYVALVCPPKAAPGKTESLRGYGVSSADDVFGTTTFTLLDTDLKFIAHSESLASPMKHIFMEWGDLFLLTTDGKVSGRDEAGVVGFERPHDPEGRGDDVDESIGSAEEEVGGAGTETGEIALGGSVRG